MKRLAFALLALGITAAPPVALAQESGASPKSESSKAAAETKEGASKEGGHEGGEGNVQMWKWANFIVLAAGLGYLAGKNGGPFFATRGARIRQDIDDAAALMAQAEAKSAEVDRRLAGLEATIASLKAEALAEAEAESIRGRALAAAEADKIRAQGEREIAHAAKAARTELKRYAAGLAIGLAETRIRAGMTPAAAEAQVDNFVKDLSSRSSSAPGA